MSSNCEEYRFILLSLYFRLRDEIDRMKIEREQDPKGSVSTPPGCEIPIESNFKQPNSNKDSGIETGDESAMVSNSATSMSTPTGAGATSYDQIPKVARPYMPSHAVAYNEEVPSEEIYGNLVQDDVYDEPPKRDSLPPSRDSLPPKPKKSQKSTQHVQYQPQNNEEIYGNLVQEDVNNEPPKRSSLPPQTPDTNEQGLTQDDIYDSPPTREHVQTLHNQETTIHQTHISPQVQEPLTQDDIYDSPPTRQSSSQNQEALTQDDIYDAPPSRPQVQALHNQEPLTQDDIYDAPPSRPQVHSMLNQEPLTQDDIYDASRSTNPPSHQGSAKRPSQLPLHIATTDNIYSSPPSNAFEGVQRPGYTPQKNMEHSTEDVYEVPDHKDDIYDSPPSNSLIGFHKQSPATTPQKEYAQQQVGAAGEDIYEAPDQPSQEIYEVPDQPDQIYDSPSSKCFTSFHGQSPVSTSPQNEFAQDGDDIYEAPDQQGSMPSRPQFVRECSETYTTMEAISEVQNELYNAIPSNIPLITSQDDTYDTPPPQRGATGRTLSETIQMKSLPDAPGTGEHTYGNIPSRTSSNKSLTPRHSNDSSRHNSLHRTHSEVIQNKDLPPEPPLTQEDIYDSPSSKSDIYRNNNNNQQQQDDVYETCHSITSSLATFDRSAGGGQCLPQGYDVTNNNDGVYDEMPSFVNKPLPTSPGIFALQQG